MLVLVGAGEALAQPAYYGRLTGLYGRLQVAVGPQGALIVLAVAVALVVSVLAGFLWLVTRYLAQVFIFLVPVVCGVAVAVLTHQAGGRPDWGLVIKICLWGLAVTFLAYLYAGVRSALKRAHWLTTERRITRGLKKEDPPVPKVEQLDI